MQEFGDIYLVTEHIETDRSRRSKNLESGMAYSVLKRFSLYTLFSSLAALVNFASRFGYDILLAGHLKKMTAYLASITLAYITGMIVNFILSKYITFEAQASGRTRREAFKFFVIAMMGLGITVIGAFAAYGVLSHFIIYVAPPLAITDELIRTLAHLFGMGVGLIVNFVCHDRFTFKQTGTWNRILLFFHRAGKSAPQSGENSK